MTTDDGPIISRREALYQVLGVGVLTFVAMVPFLYFTLHLGWVQTVGRAAVTALVCALLSPLGLIAGRWSSRRRTGGHPEG
ncbi:hypothetical protein [Luteococcus peritonei]|uniref:Uncharacterized protein n=1 Tax=Luteococcus peritonei TaxID=88874 RepID=A0ABW4RVQ7_9ACTN